MSGSDIALRALLGILAGYHTATGVTAAISPGRAARLMATFYGVNLAADSEFEYVIRMLGLLAAALGCLLAVAMLDPAANRATIVVVAALQMARAACRIVFRAQLRRDHGLSPTRNAFNAALLVVQAVLLLVLIPWSG